MNQKSLIPISALIVFGTMTLADVQAKQRLPSTREWLGFVTVFTLTSAGADLGLPVAGGFAVLIMITVFLTRGGEALQFLSTKTEKQPTKGTKEKQQESQAVKDAKKAIEPRTV